ncbi:type III pantothenate kinase [Marinobacter sp. M1N3S26]|uniref:type III pantothenate kinase n=1 Tax=unclassified Marinobacter TaxID=83889 RepID=UPI00387B8B04
MKLLIDAGNTRIKWQLRDKGQVLHSGAGLLESDQLFEGITPAHWRKLSSVAVSTVRSEAARRDLENTIATYTRLPVRFFWTRRKFGSLTCAYEDASTMGADRWHALIGAWDMIGGACVVVDAGSAITLDWIDDRGGHLGGYILPGRDMMVASLRQSTARVMFDDSQAVVNTTPGRSTAECVFHGVSWLIQALASELGRQVAIPVLVTGGDGSLIKKALDTAGPDSLAVSRLCPGLVLDGLALVEAE